MVAIAEIYFDETGTHDGSQVMGVAGYVFMKSKARLFSQEWSKHLRSKKIPYFHMKDCAPGNGPYLGWEPEQRVEHEKSLISLIKKTSLFGFASCCELQHFVDGRDELSRRYSAYTMMLSIAINAACNHLRDRGFKGRTSFVFEAGHNSRTQAEELLGRLTKMFTEQYFNPSYAFVHKSDAPPLQAADLLAWLSRNALMKTLDGKPVRRDFVALASDGHEVSYYDTDTLKNIGDVYAGRQVGSPASGFLLARLPR